jgi:hypothetical protein
MPVELVPDRPLSTDTALHLIFGPERTEKIYALALALDDTVNGVLCDSLDLHLDALAGPADPLAVAAAVSVHRLITRPCEPITADLPCDCGQPS